MFYSHSPTFDHLSGFENISITDSAEINNFMHIYLIIEVDPQKWDC